MASVPRNATPPRYVPKVEPHAPSDRMLPLDVCKDSNDVRSGGVSCYESIDMEEYGHLLVSVAVPRRKTHEQVLQKEGTL